MTVISTIPTDVLSEIFHLLCEESIFLCELSNSWCKERFPWAVGLVCRQWRTAFLSYPPIWASLELSDEDTYQFTGQNRSESYAKEINRRLALYLERSGGYPLTLDLVLWSDHNKAFTTMALEMLLACSHRWRTVNFDLTRGWQVDSILPCKLKGKLPTLEWLAITLDPNHKCVQDIFEVAPRLTYAYIDPWDKRYGCILPWTQLTELVLTLDRVFVIENGDVLNILPMLHNIKELRLCFDHDKLELEVGFPQFAPTSLNQLRVLEVPYPPILSWFEAPSLCEIYFADHQEDYDELLDVHEEISSLIQRSSCRIRKLSFESGRDFYVGTLKDVEELVLEWQYSDEIHSRIDVSSLPNLRHITIICMVDESFQSAMNSLTAVLKSARVPTRGECSSGTPITLLECVMVELRYDYVEPEIPKKLLEIANEWPVVVFRTQCS